MKSRRELDDESAAECAHTFMRAQRNFAIARVRAK
jgi:hypothetical protein